MVASTYTHRHRFDSIISGEDQRTRSQSDEMDSQTVKVRESPGVSDARC
jgi:hypothetical protein